MIHVFLGITSVITLALCLIKQVMPLLTYKAVAKIAVQIHIYRFINLPFRMKLLRKTQKDFPFSVSPCDTFSLIPSQDNPVLSFPFFGQQ